ncbi:hypothetical protein HI030_04250 [Staphylococcus haemolyticus]|nr:hypothetical protein HI030_04250 [Staphylococcus haemolyticus]
MQKIDFSPNRINLPKFMATQLVVILFMIVFTYKWAFMFTTIHEQTFLGLIDLYLVGITFTNKFEYVHPSDEGLIMYHQRPIQANNEFE